METFLGLTGSNWALVGAVIAFAGGAIGSAVGITYAAGAGTGTLAEDPAKFGRILPIVAMPGTQGIYGFITAILVWFLFLTEPQTLAKPTIGFQVGLACLPVAFACLFSGIYQGKASVGSIGLVARRVEESGRALIFPALVETYAVLSLILTILILLDIGGLT